MIRINLLPYRKARKKENVRRQLSIFGLGVVLVGFCLYYGNIVFDRSLIQEQDRLSQARAELTQMKKITKEIEEIKKKLNTIKKKTEIIRSLEDGRKQQVVLLDTLTRVIIPQRMWFTNLAVVQNSVSIGGFALDQTTVADFMRQLETCGLFSSVTLKSIKHQVIKGVELKNFDISCGKNPLKKSEPPKEKGGA